MLAVLLIVALSGVPVLQAPVIGPQDAIGFDYPDADVSGYQVTHFENQYDGGAWTSISMPPVAAQGNGVSTYRVIPTTQTGTHNIAFRACNAVGCGGSSSPFAFAVLGAPSNAPGNVRKIPRE